MKLAPLPIQAMSVSASRVVSVAKAEFGLTDDQLDWNVGVVGARLSVGTDPDKQNQEVEIVTARQDVRGPDGLLYHRLVVVVDARTGAYLYAYTAEPGNEP